ITYQPQANSNVPYFFSLELVGFFEVAEAVPDDRIDRLVKTNGPSMLYGIAREVVRDITSRGPYLGVLLPSVSFYEPPTAPGETSNAESARVAESPTRSAPAAR